jgi:hypothetical protein
VAYTLKSFVLEYLKTMVLGRAVPSDFVAAYVKDVSVQVASEIVNVTVNVKAVYPTI